MAYRWLGCVLAIHYFLYYFIILFKLRLIKYIYIIQFD
jgi:hypothetical protein